MKRFFSVFLLFVFCADAHAIGGPAQTKRERLAAERQTGRPAPAAPSPDTGLREEIERTYLLEDYAAAERLSREYLAGDIPEADRRDVEYLRALCLLKLRKPDQARPLLEKLLAGAKTERERARLLASMGQTRPLVLPTPALPLHQKSIEEISQYSVQVGSFSREKNALSLIRQLTQANYHAFVDTSLPSLYRVRVGPLASPAEAARLEALLKKDGYPTKIYP